jgi:hypothetical protein
MRSISLVSLVLLCAACGGNKDALEKKVSGLQEEVTRLQNGNDRLAERLQAVEMGMLKSEPRSLSQSSAENDKDRVVRPPLKVVHVGPGSENVAEEEAAEPTPAPVEEKRPVLKDYGSGRANKGGMGQNGVRPSAPTPPGTLK